MTCLEFNILLVDARFCLGAKKKVNCDCVSFNCSLYLTNATFNITVASLIFNLTV